MAAARGGANSRRGGMGWRWPPAAGGLQASTRGRQTRSTHASEPGSGWSAPLEPGNACSPCPLCTSTASTTPQRTSSAHCRVLRQACGNAAFTPTPASRYWWNRSAASCARPRATRCQRCSASRPHPSSTRAAAGPAEPPAGGVGKQRCTGRGEQRAPKAPTGLAPWRYSQRQ